MAKESISEFSKFSLLAPHFFPFSSVFFQILFSLCLNYSSASFQLPQFLGISFSPEETKHTLTYELLLFLLYPGFPLLSDTKHFKGLPQLPCMGSLPHDSGSSLHLFAHFYFLHNYYFLPSPITLIQIWSLRYEKKFLPRKIILHLGVE